VNCTASTPVNCQTFSITDGYHTGMQMGSNGQLFIGSKACTGLSGNGVCLSILDTAKMQVVPTPKNSPVGDVTGMAPIPNQNVVYVCQGGILRIYDTATDQLKVFPTGEAQPNVIGQAVDVKVIDF
jgi:DNA-binding beta-propeller fold protein YncE